MVCILVHHERNCQYINLIIMYIMCEVFTFQYTYHWMFLINTYSSIYIKRTQDVFNVFIEKILIFIESDCGY